MDKINQLIELNRKQGELLEELRKALLLDKYEYCIRLVKNEPKEDPLCELIKLPERELMKVDKKSRLIRWLNIRGITSFITYEEL